MPKKYNLTRYDLIANSIKKLSSRELYANGEVAEALDVEYTDEMLRTMAIIVASFSSSHSWKTFRGITEGSGQLNSDEIREEYQEACRTRWKNVSQNDIGELSNTNIPDSRFFEWLFFNVDKKEHPIYKDAWGTLKREFQDGCDIS